MLQREVRLIFGQTGSGKTYRAAQHFNTCPRAIFVGAGFTEDEKHFRAVFFDDFRELVLYLDKIRAFENPRVPFRVGYTPRLNEYELMFEIPLELGSCWAFYEELDRFGDPADIPAYGEVITRGRHYSVNLYGMSTHPYNCPVDFRRQCTSLISYRQIEPRDVKFIADLVGPRAYELPKLPGPGDGRYPPFPYLEWDGARGARIVDTSGIAVKPPTIDELSKSRGNDGGLGPGVNSAHEQT